MSSSTNSNVNFAINMMGRLNAQNVAAKTIQRYFRGGYFKITGYNASTKYPGGFDTLKPFLNRQYNSNIKKVSGLTANYRESNKASDAIQFKISKNGQHVMRLYKSGSITIVGGFSQPYLASGSLNTNRVKSVPLSIIQKVLPDVQDVKMNSLILTRHMPKKYTLDSDAFRNFLHARPETEERAHVYQFTLNGTTVQLFPGKGTVVLPSVKPDEIQSVISRVNSFMKSIPAQFIRGSKLAKNYKSPKREKTATNRRPACPKKDCPVPYSFTGICQPKNGIHRYVFPDKATGKPCCFKKPQSTKRKDIIIKRFANFGIDIPNTVKPVLGLPSTYTRGESSRRMSFVKRGSTLLYNNKNISHRSFKKPNLEKLATNVGVNVSSMKKKTAKNLLNAIERTARNKGFVKNVRNRPFLINGNSFKPFYGFGTKQEISSMTIPKILDLTETHYGVTLRRRLEGFAKKANIQTALKRELTAMYPVASPNSSASGSSSSSINSNFNRELTAMLRNKSKSPSKSGSSSINSNFNRELTAMLKNQPSPPKRLEMLAKAKREEL